MILRLSLAAVLLLAACTSPVGVRRVDPISVQRNLTGNVLSTGWPSAPSLQLLSRLGLYDDYFEDAPAVLAALRARLPASGADDLVFALSELSFFHAMESGAREYYLASAVYAYALLFPGIDGAPRLEKADPRLRLSHDLYNRALTEALLQPERGEMELAAGRYPLPWGELVLELDDSELDWAGYRLHTFLPAAELDVHGLRNRYRWPGIGAPIVAGIGKGDPERTVARADGAERVAVGLKVAVTAFLRVNEARAQVTEPEMRGTLEVYSLEDGVTVEVDGQEVPLELETSSSLAYTLDRSPLWDFEIWGFLEGSFRGFRGYRSEDDDDGLFFLRPYRRGRIPVVLVHGTASSPARWAELVNELENDPEISPHYQVWLFLYNTGNPIPYSAARLRRALENTVRELDPDGADAALQRMVVIGHSQGGLLTKLTAVDSGAKFWDLVSTVPIDQIDADPETLDFIHRLTFFTPEPFVKRVVFVATPHRGSYLAGFGLVQRLAAWMINLPSDFVGRTYDVVRRNPGALTVRAVGRSVTSIDQMSPSNPFIETLSTIPVAPGIAANSIVAIDGDGPIEEEDDGVVEYASAHIDGVESEQIVYSSHSTQAEPDTINEIRRILIAHRALYPATDPAPPAGELVDEK